MQIIISKKKAEDMRNKLKTIITYTRGISAWEELLRTEGEIRKKRQAMIYAQKERQRFWIEMFFSSIIVIAALAGLWFVVQWLMAVHEAKQSVY